MRSLSVKCKMMQSPFFACLYCRAASSTDKAKEKEEKEKEKERQAQLREQQRLKKQQERVEGKKGVCLGV